MAAAFTIVAAVPFTARFFALTFTDPVNDAVAVAVGVAGTLALTAVYRLTRRWTGTAGRPPDGPR